MKTYAWYFPNWHRTEQNDKWHGTGWTEWQCVKYATPRFEGHLQPKKPLWGYGDESKPEVMEQKIKALTDYGGVSQLPGSGGCHAGVEGHPLRTGRAFDRITDLFPDHIYTGDIKFP